MLREIFLPLVKYFTPFNIFRYLTFRSAYAAVTALVICYLIGPWMIEKLRVLKFGQSIRTDGPQTHLAKTGTPTMGGILIILAVVVSVVLWIDVKSGYSWIALLSLVGFGLIGAADDLLKIKKHTSDGLSPIQKLALQFVVSGAAAYAIYRITGPTATKLYVPFFKVHVIDLGAFWLPIAMIYVTAWSNAVNITDGLDGLASGLVIFAILAFSILTYITGRADWSQYLGIPYIKQASELTVFNFALLGACVGFLWFNAHPAEVFMGDAGSLSLGGVLGVLSLMVKKELLLLVIGGVFVMELGSVMLQVLYFKMTKGKRLFRMAPLHHHFELLGLKETKVVVRFWILGGIFALIALSTLKIQ
ncbi:MAG: phospho-N-acetylmuramoyl-pentapeptide-transferase [Spirochaetia bacterium]|jgi:phospho-N-acetylmuramoyl-pentapeptide-transferase|uniref:Phospho-N-acetylmuramoyl-pentapeptide-transferase n=1 Tax=uncultured spirochete TaxID=156406 RepID=A0A3P3XFR6_9SPIR|nr:phospho-N-acetylmuramoyl-pentapeptide-transferase [Rectinema subterraneum]MDQ7795194.1 phospho-N-acetylmuramoyl-pentapeptide-transferase [Spirochaetia bacterium]SLM10358.1 phospho-N-acetylmuramoyl-pentapeptide transferase [uncultured spirochete]